MENIWRRLEKHLFYKLSNYQPRILNEQEVKLNDFHIYRAMIELMYGKYVYEITLIKAEKTMFKMLPIEEAETDYGMYFYSILFDHVEDFFSEFNIEADSDTIQTVQKYKRIIDIKKEDIIDYKKFQI